MKESIKIKIEEMKKYLLDYQKVIDDNYSLFENLRDLLQMEKSAVYSQYHKEVHKIFYAVFGFYCRTLYTVRVFCDNNNEVVAKQISYTNGNKDEFENKELFINLWNSVSEEEGISFHSRDFSHFEVGEYQYPASTLGKHSLADYVFLKKGFFGVRDDFKIDTFELSESFKRIIITKDLKIDDTSGLLLAEICKLYIEQNYSYKEVNYHQFLKKYKTTAKKISAGEVNDKLEVGKDGKENSSKFDCTKLENLLKYLTYKDNKDSMFADIERFSKKSLYEIAIVALIIYESEKNIIRNKPQTFRKWVKEFACACNIEKNIRYNKSQLKTRYKDKIKEIKGCFYYL